MTRRSRWPSGVPVFRNLLRDRMITDGNQNAVNYPEIMVGTEVDGPIWDMFNRIELVRPDNQDRLFYELEYLKPLNADARIMLAIARAK